jgi:hypothetical protein
MRRDGNIYLALRSLAVVVAALRVQNTLGRVRMPILLKLFNDIENRKIMGRCVGPGRVLLPFTT